MDENNSAESGAPSSGIRVHLALPCYGGSYKSVFVRSILRLMDAWRQADIGFDFNEVDCCDIEVARNYLISEFYFGNPSCTHVLFIDNDMGFDSNLILRMLELKKDVVGVIAPKREIDLKKLHQLGDLPFEKALAKSVDFLVTLVRGNSHHKVEKGFIEVESCGTGILLISRKCIDQMITKCPDIIEQRSYLNFPFAKHLDQFITPFKRITEGDRLVGEDISFCMRWVQQCGGKIFANIDSDIQHNGNFTVKSKFMHRINRELPSK